MHPLLAMLARWPGRPATKSLLEAKGYWLPERFREIIVAHCGSASVTTLDRYWDEISLEYLCTAGLVDSENRSFAGETAYRSEYLDDLASLAAKRGIVKPVVSLHEELRALKIEGLKPGSTFWPLIADQMERDKIAEIKSFGIS